LFRAKYDYDNLLYVIAGEIIASIRKSWKEYMEEKI
jgi:CubicO group peptidase (beta-lactamase class C family)